MIDYITRILMWAGIVLPAPGILILTLLKLNPGYTIIDFVSSKLQVFEAIRGIRLSPIIWLILNILLFLGRYMVQLIVVMDLFRGFILLAIVSFFGIQVFRNLVDFIDSYFDRVTAVGGETDVTHIQIYRQIEIIYRVPEKINKSGAFLALGMIGASAVFFVYALVRLRSENINIFLPFCGFGVVVSVYIQLLICNYGAHVNEKSTNLLGKFKKWVAKVAERKKRKDLVQTVSSLVPLALLVGVGDVTLFTLEKGKKMFVLRQMLDYSMEAILT